MFPPYTNSFLTVVFDNQNKQNLEHSGRHNLITSVETIRHYCMPQIPVPHLNLHNLI